MTLDATQWEEITKVFGTSLQFVLDNSHALSEEARTRLAQFVHGFSMNQKPYMLVTAQGVQHAVETVFVDDTHRDFVLTLTFQFLSRWGASAERYSQLIDTLAFAVSATDGEVGGRATQRATNAIPKPILEDLPQLGTARGLLQENKWLVTLLLLLLVYAIPEPKPPGKPSKKQ